MNEKGISPIIATVLLLMITVAVAGGVGVWLNSLQQRSQSDIEESTTLITGQTQQAITVSFLTCKTGATNNNVTAVIRNSGTKRIAEGDVELVISSSDGKTSLSFGTETSTWTNLDVDQTSQPAMLWDLSTMSPQITFTQGETYLLTITVPGGAKASKACTASA